MIEHARAIIKNNGLNVSKDLRVEAEDKSGEIIPIEPGDIYIGRRNTGWHLGVCSEVLHGDVYSMDGPVLNMIYPYKTCECHKVKAILFS